MLHDAALQDQPDARVREPMRSRPGPTRRRGGPRPEDIGFGRRSVAATSFGSVLNPVNSSIIAVASASLISLSFGHAATDAGLQRLAVILTVAAAALLVATLADRKLATLRPDAR